MSNKIVIGSTKDCITVITDQTPTFTAGAATINMSSIATAYGKTVLNAIVQLKSASGAVVTSATVSGNTVTIKAANLTGTAFAGTIAVTVVLYLG